MLVVILLLFFISLLIFILLLFFISFPGYFIMSLALHPGVSDLGRLPFLFHLPQALRFWVGIFYPQVFFTLHSFPTFLAQPAFIKVSLGAGTSSLMFAGLHTDPQSTDPAHLFVWFTVIHNPLYILDLYLYMSILQKFYLWWKLWFFSRFLRIRLLNKSATTLISQQPWKHKAGATLISNHKLQNNCFLKKYISEHKYNNYVNSCEFMWIYG